VEYLFFFAIVAAILCLLLTITL